MQKAISSELVLLLLLLLFLLSSTTSSLLASSSTSFFISNSLVESSALDSFPTCSKSVGSKMPSSSSSCRFQTHISTYVKNFQTQVQSKVQEHALVSSNSSKTSPDPPSPDPPDHSVFLLSFLLHVLLQGPACPARMVKINIHLYS